MACLGIVTGICSSAQLHMDDQPPINSTDNTVLYSTEGVKTESDTNRLFVIHDINISGNEKTKPAIILRELPFQMNEAYPLGTIVEKFRKARRQLMNTGLFRNVVVSLKSFD